MVIKMCRHFCLAVFMMFFLISAVGITWLQAEVEALKTELISLSSDGEAADGIAKNPAISGNGRYVVFDSQAKNLVPNDTNNATDVFLHDRQTGETIRVSVSSYGTQGNGTSYDSSISRDGQYIAFASGASSFFGDDTNGTWDVFVYDTQTRKLERVSESSAGIPGNDSSVSPFISGNGKFVVFESDSNNLVEGDTNNHRDVFVHDRQTGETTRVSESTNGTASNAYSGRPSISDDGRIVVFESDASTLIANDSNSVRDIFLHDRQTKTTEIVSVSSSGMLGLKEAGGKPYVSSDGNLITFESEAGNLVEGDTNGYRDVFVRNRQTKETFRVSTNTEGIEADRGSGGPRISADGRFVSFWSYARNWGNNTSYAQVYLKNTQSGDLVIYSVNDQGDAANSSAAGSRTALSEDGSFVVFSSDATNLVPGNLSRLQRVFLHTKDAPSPTATPSPSSTATATEAATSTDTASPAPSPTNTKIPPTHTPSATPRSKSHLPVLVYQPPPTATPTITLTPSPTPTRRPIFIGLEARWDGRGYLRTDEYHEPGTHMTMVFSRMVDSDIAEFRNHHWYDPNPLGFDSDEWFEYYSVSTGDFKSSSSPGNPAFKWGSYRILPYRFSFQDGDIEEIDGQEFRVSGPYQGVGAFGQRITYWRLVNRHKFLYVDSGGDWKQYVHSGDITLEYDINTRLRLKRDVLRRLYYDGDLTQYTFQYIDYLTSSNAYSDQANWNRSYGMEEINEQGFTKTHLNIPAELLQPAP